MALLNGPVTTVTHVLALYRMCWPIPVLALCEPKIKLFVWPRRAIFGAFLSGALLFRRSYAGALLSGAFLLRRQITACLRFIAAQPMIYLHRPL